MESELQPESQRADLSPEVRFVGLSRLAPTGLAGPALEKWLKAPIAGVPLYKRLFEPLVGHQFRQCIAGPSTVAYAIERFTRDAPCFGFRLRVAARARSAVSGCVDFPTDGLLDLGHPPGTSGSTLSVSTCPDLLHVSKMALEGDLVGRPANGRFENDLLLGHAAQIGERVRVLGVAAVGARSRVQDDVVLGAGAVVGERCTIGAGAVLADCVILNGGIVPAGARLIDVVWMG